MNPSILNKTICTVFYYFLFVYKLRTPQEPDPVLGNDYLFLPRHFIKTKGFNKVIISISKLKGILSMSRDYKTYP